MGLVDYYVTAKSAVFYGLKASSKQTLGSKLHCMAMEMCDWGNER